MIFDGVIESFAILIWDPDVAIAVKNQDWNFRVSYIFDDVSP